MRTRRFMQSVCVVLLFLVGIGVRTGRTPELDAAQSLTGQEPITSWWAAPEEPDMLETQGTLKDPETVQVHLIFNHQERWIHGYEAIVYLLVRDYVKYVNVNGQLRLVTTPKYNAWKNSKASVTPQPPVKKGPGPTPVGITGVTFSGELDPVKVADDVNTMAKAGYTVSWQAPKMSITLTSTQVGSKVFIYPQKPTMVRNQRFRDGSTYDKSATMDLGEGTVKSNSVVSGPTTNIKVTYTSTPVRVGSGVRNTGDPDCDWTATRDNQGVWHLSIAEAQPGFLLK
jgi:hypothetical protein